MDEVYLSDEELESISSFAEYEMEFLLMQYLKEER